MIVIDVNSGEDEIYRELSGQVELEREKISNDIYVVGEKDKVMVERKTTKDYIGSLRSGSLFKQLKTCDLLLIEGDWIEAIKWKNTSYEEIDGSLASIFIDWGMPVIHTISRGQMIDLFLRIENQLEPSSSCNYYPSRVGKVDESVRPVFLTKGFKAIGDSTAEKLLDKFESFINIVNASMDELMEVDGIGENIAEHIYEKSRQNWEK